MAMASTVTTKAAEHELGSDTRVVSLAVGQLRILELIASGAPLSETLDALLVFLERGVPEMLCSILLLDADGRHLRHGSAPSLPIAYCQAIDGAPIGPRAGSCGTAAYVGQQVVVTDIETDSLWVDYRELAREHGLRACWSTPIRGADGDVLGTFAMYFREPGAPTEEHRGLIAIATHVAAIALGKEQRERALRDSEERYRLLNLATNDAVWDWDLKTNTLWWSEAVGRLFGYHTDEVSRQYQWWVERVHLQDRQRVHDSLQKAADSTDTGWHEEYRFRRRDGSYAEIQDRGYVMRDGTGRAVRMIGTMQDISERNSSQQRIERLAYQEPVTKLPNRTAMHRDLAAALARPNLRGQLALLLLNLDCFRDINDCLGHQNGDLLLQQLAEKLRLELSPFVRVACLGGDEFALLVPRLSRPAQLERLLVTLRECLQRPIEIAQVPVRIDATVGIAIFPKDGETPEALWRHAHIALRTAKERREPHLYYDPSIDHYDPARLALVGELRTAIERDQLLLHYQPKLDLRTGRTIGVEALVRWKHPVRGLIFPDAFVPLAERTGLINPMTAWVLRTALREAKALERNRAPLELSVNLSARNLHDPSLCHELLSLVRNADFPVKRLTLEITETAIMADPTRAKAVLGDLHAAGIHLSMDDFGIGQSSLAYLKDLPITKMKIDKSFVMGFDQPKNVAIVRSALDLARNMGLAVTAEGIEDERTYLALRELGCDLGQGYFFSRPLPPDALETWLADSPWGLAASGSHEV